MCLFQVYRKVTQLFTYVCISNLFKFFSNLGYYRIMSRVSVLYIVSPCWLSILYIIAGGEGDDRGWDGWMASLAQWTWVWVNSGSWWWTERLGVLRFTRSQRVGHDWTELSGTQAVPGIWRDTAHHCKFWRYSVSTLNNPSWVNKMKEKLKVELLYKRQS